MNSPVQRLSEQDGFPNPLQFPHEFQPANGQGLVTTLIPGVRFFWVTQSVARSPFVYSASIVIIVQGHKTGYLGDRILQYNENNYLILGVPLPIECETHATPDTPTFGLLVDIDVSFLHELVAMIGADLPPIEPDAYTVPKGVEPVELDAEMRDVTARLLRCLNSPLDSRALGRSLVREIHYRALMGHHSQVLYALTHQHGHYARIAKALDRMHQNYATPLTVETLAEEAHMSVSAFHRTFKQVTEDSPLQYLKKIRLNKAKSLIVHEGIRANVAANRVGYESASQFSREFKRYFNVVPSKAEAIGYARLVSAVG
ncbi:MAG: AraC family transcriptional regulator N-terminal domain-containing protein [Leptolyngbyaceae cyanobacterium]